MKYISNLIKRLCLGIFSIYSINVMFSMINIVIPINVYTICMSSFLGVFGIVAIIFMKMVI